MRHGAGTPSVFLILLPSACYPSTDGQPIAPYRNGLGPDQHGTPCAAYVAGPVFLAVPKRAFVRVGGLRGFVFLFPL